MDLEPRSKLLAFNMSPCGLQCVTFSEHPDYPCSDNRSRRVANLGGSVRGWYGCAQQRGSKIKKKEKMRVQISGCNRSAVGLVHLRVGE